MTPPRGGGSQAVFARRLVETEDAALAIESTQDQRASLAGAFRKALFNELRLQWRGDHTGFDPSSTAPAVQVLNAFNNGGAQLSGDRRVSGGPGSGGRPEAEHRCGGEILGSVDVSAQ